LFANLLPGWPAASTPQRSASRASAVFPLTSGTQHCCDSFWKAVPTCPRH